MAAKRQQGAKRKWNPAHHPRDSRGRFTKSATRVARPADIRKAKAAIAAFDAKEHLYTSTGDASAYLATIAGGHSPAVDDYRATSWQDVNRGLRSGAGHESVADIDAAMQPLPDDLVLTRNVPLAMFADKPIEDLDRMVVRDAAYAPTVFDGGLGGWSNAEVTMHIAAPAGTRAIVDPTSREVILDRDTEMAISRVVPNGRGQYDMYLTVLPKRDALPGQQELSLTPEPEDLIADVDLESLDDDDLYDLFSRASASDSPSAGAAIVAIDAEMARRERQEQEVSAQESWLQSPSDESFGWPEPEDMTDEQRRIDDLVNGGRDYLDAYAEVYGVDPDRLARDEAASAVERRAGETLDQAVRRSYDEWVHLQYLRAETDTRGHMLTPEAQVAGINPIELFEGTSARARKYASEDLLRWWSDNVRLTFTEFKAQMLGREADIRAAEITRLQGNARDFI